MDLSLSLVSLENETAESLATKMLGKKLSKIKNRLFSYIKNKKNLKAQNLSIKL